MSNSANPSSLDCLGPGNDGTGIGRIELHDLTFWGVVEGSVLCTIFQILCETVPLSHRPKYYSDIHERDGPAGEVTRKLSVMG